MVLGKRKRKSPQRLGEEPKAEKQEDNNARSYTKEDLQKLKVPQLKKICQELKISSKGRKAELIQSILDTASGKEESEEITASPPRKRQKITKTATVEVIEEKKEEEESKTKAIEKKRTSFIEEEVGDDTMATLSSGSKSKLLKRLSSIINLEDPGMYKYNNRNVYLLCLRISILRTRTNQSCSNGISFAVSW